MRWKAHDGGIWTAQAVADLQQLVGNPSLRSFLDLIPDGIMIIDLRGMVSVANRAAQVLIGSSGDSCIGSPFTAVLRDIELDSRALLQAVSNGSRFTKVETAADGRSLMISSRPLHRAEGDLTFTVIIFQNLDSLSKQFASAGKSEFVALTDRPSSSRSGAEISFGPAASQLVEQAMRGLRMNIRVLLIGESGAGKTEVARYVHHKTLGQPLPFVHVNCASIPDSLFESEMFGYSPGSFTGALNRGKKGLIEAADGGTLFLDEVGEIPLHCQSKLLKFLEDGVIQRIGATGGHRVSVKVLSATNRDLTEMVAAKQFRPDLYYRLSSLVVPVPPLRESREMISPLLNRFVENLNSRREIPFAISDDCLARLLVYSYPGNVRELQNIAEHLAVVCDDVAEEWHLPSNVLSDTASAHLTVAKIMDGSAELIAADAAGGALRPEYFISNQSSFPNISLKDEVRRYELHLMREAIRRVGSKRKAAEALGIDIATIVRKTRDF